METATIPTESDEKIRRSPFLPVLLFLFAGSGCSALIYEVAWYQVLQLRWVPPRFPSAFCWRLSWAACASAASRSRAETDRQHPLRVYATLEFGIAIFGILVTLAMPLISRVYIIGAGNGMPGMLLRDSVAAVCMLPSTILMGASLPAIVRGIEATPRGVSWWALLYGGNTAGAVFGCLLPASICCAFTTWRRRLMWRPRSISLLPRSAIGSPVMPGKCGGTPAADRARPLR